MTIKKNYELVVQVHYRDTEKSEGLGRPVDYRCSTRPYIGRQSLLPYMDDYLPASEMSRETTAVVYRLSKKDEKERLYIDSLRPDLFQENLDILVKEIIEVLMRSKKEMEEKSQAVIDEILTKSVIE